MTSPALGARDLAGCEHRLALDFAAERAVRGGEQSADVALRIQAAADHRTKVRALLHGLHSDQSPGTFVAIDQFSSGAERVAATARACAAGASWIADAALPTDRSAGRRGHSELLAHDGTGYVPVIVVNHRVSYPVAPDPTNSVQPDRVGITTSPLWGWLPGTDQSRGSRNNRRDQLRLAHLYRMLQAQGLAGSPFGGVIGLDADCIVVYDLAGLLDAYDATLARRRRIAAQQITTVPSRVGECRGCEWWQRCEPELAARHDVSLVVNGAQTTTLAENGVTTIDQLAAATEAPDEFNGSFDEAVIFAQCWLTDVPLVRRHRDVKVTRADVEVDVDMESYGEDGAYLWGTLLTDNTTPTVAPYRPFVTWTPLPTRDEARSFAEFWQWLMAVRADARAAGKSFAAYCYSEQAENRWLRGSADRFAGRPGIPSRVEVDAFIASPEWVDIYAAVGRNFLSAKGKGLKRVAPLAGFTWRDDDAGGAASMGWYRRAVGLDGPVDLAQRQRLLEYNEDDVTATKVLREWMDRHAATTVPTVAELQSTYRRRTAGSGPKGADGVEEPAAAQ